MTVEVAEVSYGGLGYSIGLCTTGCTQEHAVYLPTIHNNVFLTTFRIFKMS